MEIELFDESFIICASFVFGALLNFAYVIILSIKFTFINFRKSGDNNGRQF